MTSTWNWNLWISQISLCYVKHVAMKRPSATVLPRSKHTSPRCMWSHWRPGCNGSRATAGAREGQLNFWCLGLSGSATYSFQDIPFISCSCLMVSYHMISLNLLAELVPVLPCGACWICFNKSSCIGLFGFDQYQFEWQQLSVGSQEIQGTKSKHFPTLTLRSFNIALKMAQRRFICPSEMRWYSMAHHSTTRGISHKNSSSIPIQIPFYHHFWCLSHLSRKMKLPQQLNGPAPAPRKLRGTNGHTSGEGEIRWWWTMNWRSYFQRNPQYINIRYTLII